MNQTPIALYMVEANIIVARLEKLYDLWGYLLDYFSGVASDHDDIS